VFAYLKATSSRVEINWVRKVSSNLRDVVHCYHSVGLEFREHEAISTQSNVTSIRYKQLHLCLVRIVSWNSKKHQPEKKSFHHELVCVQLPTSADNVALPTFGRRTSLLRHGCCWAPAVQQTVQQSIDIYCLPGPQQQTRSSGVRTERDGRTDARQIHGHAPHTTPAVLIT